MSLSDFIRISYDLCLGPHTWKRILRAQPKRSLSAAAPLRLDGRQDFSSIFGEGAAFAALVVEA
jgi:hypothetical protein